MSDQDQLIIHIIIVTQERKKKVRKKEGREGGREIDPKKVPQRFKESILNYPIEKVYLTIL
jgi:hypothetical protein